MRHMVVITEQTRCLCTRKNSFYGLKYKQTMGFYYTQHKAGMGQTGSFCSAVPLVGGDWFIAAVAGIRRIKMTSFECWIQSAYVPNVKICEPNRLRREHVLKCIMCTSICGRVELKRYRSASMNAKTFTSVNKFNVGMCFWRRRKKYRFKLYRKIALPPNYLVCCSRTKPCTLLKIIFTFVVFTI